MGVIFLAFSAVLSGASGWKSIQEFGKLQIEWLKQHTSFTHGIPHRHTIARILKAIVAESLLEALLNWVNERRSQEGKPIIAMDGKILRGADQNEAKTAAHLVTSYSAPKDNIESQQKFQQVTKRFLASRTKNVGNNPLQPRFPCVPQSTLALIEYLTLIQSVPRLFRTGKCFSSAP
ncbi:protein of unknown function [Xenorhabdus poinarii G6]|uniref:H repeat-associated protein N-terminal domain-containing protein n=1 Tax=Xenorhabdus poinarii G6 TaxID=1354304 RepID=A0A068R5Z6_9GAMM|nr:protein of unknown function [Xenorhabdus poinarii G6]